MIGCPKEQMMEQQSNLNDVAFLAVEGDKMPDDQRAIVCWLVLFLFT